MLSVINNLFSQKPSTQSISEINLTENQSSDCSLTGSNPKQKANKPWIQLGYEDIFGLDEFTNETQLDFEDSDFGDHLNEAKNIMYNPLNYKFYKNYPGKIVMDNSNNVYKIKKLNNGCRKWYQFEEYKLDKTIMDNDSISCVDGTQILNSYSTEEIISETGGLRELFGSETSSRSLDKPSMNDVTEKKSEN